MFRLALWTLRICGLIPTLNLSAFPLYYSAHFHTHSFVAKLIRDERELFASPCSPVALIALLTTTEVWSCTILLTSASLHFQAIYRRIQTYSSLIWFDAKQMGTPLQLHHQVAAACDIFRWHCRGGSMLMGLSLRITLCGAKGTRSCHGQF